MTAWGGSKTSAATNADIKSSLGLGIVRFKEKSEEPQIEAYDYEYRVNTDVITAVRISGGQSDPDSPTRVSFNIGGQTYSVGNVYYPEGDSQLAWVKWKTPDTEQNMSGILQSWTERNCRLWTSFAAAHPAKIMPRK